MKMLLTGAALAVLTAGAASAGTISITNPFGTMPGLSGSLDVTEEAILGGGVYGVENNINGSLLAFGVSNNIGSLPGLFDPGFGDFGCAVPDLGGLICYEAFAVTEFDWDNQIVHYNFDLEIEYTFQDAFGDFADVAGDDDMFNWYVAVDGDLQPGDSIDGFFGFLNAQVASNIIGIGSNVGGTAAFAAGPVGAPGTQPNPVPLPAAGWMLIAGVGGLAAMGRRRKAA